MKTKIPILSQEVYCLKWNNIFQMVTPDKAKVQNYVKNSIINFACHADQFSISSNYCKSYKVNDFCLNLKPQTND